MSMGDKSPPGAHRARLATWAAWGLLSIAGVAQLTIVDCRPAIIGQSPIDSTPIPQYPTGEPFMVPGPKPGFGGP